MEGDAGTSRLNPTGRRHPIRSERVRRTIRSIRRNSPPTSEVATSDADGQSTWHGVRRRSTRRAARRVRPRLARRDLRWPARADRRRRRRRLPRAASRTTRAKRSPARTRSRWQRAKDCVTATQAPDIAAMTASQTKIIECSTGDFAVQANLYSSMLVEAYQAANVAVQVSDMRGAVEKHNDDGSVDVLVAVRVKVTNSQAADQEQGYRLRVNMAPATAPTRSPGWTRSRRDGSARRRHRDVDHRRTTPSAYASWPARAGALALDVAARASP